MGEAALAEVSSTQVMCSQYPDKPAVALFRWPWGEQGACSAEYQVELRMLARNLKRSVEFSPLPTPVRALSTDERVGFHARILAGEEELKASRARGLDLYNENSRLADEVRRLRARNASLEDNLREVQKQADIAVEERNELLAQAGEATEEVARLGAVLGRETALADELRAEKAATAALTQQNQELSTRLEKANERLLEAGALPE